MLSEKLTTRPSRSGRLFLLLMVELAVGVALSMAFAHDAKAKQRHNNHHKPPTTNSPAPTPTCNLSPVYSGESVAWAWGVIGQVSWVTEPPPTAARRCRYRT